MATSDEPPPAGLAAGLSRGAWGSPPSFDVVRRSPAPPFWGGTPAPPPSSNFLDLNAPFEEDPQPVSRGPPSFVDHLSGPAGGTISFLNPVKEVEGEGLRSFMDASGSSRNQNDGDEASGPRDQEPGQDTGPFVDYLSQFSGKEGDPQEKERSKPVREASDFPDELLSLSSSYHKKPGRPGRPVADGAALFLASGRGQDGPPLAASEGRKMKPETRVGPMSVNFGSNRLDDISNSREVEKIPHGGEAQPVASFEERSLFPRNAVNGDRMDPFYPMSNLRRDERGLMLPTSSARETLDLSNNLSFKEERGVTSRQSRVSDSSSKEGMLLSLKRPYEESAEDYSSRREEEAVQTSLYPRQGDARDGDEHSDVAEVSHPRRRRERPGGEEHRFQNDQKRVQNDQSANDDKSIVWPPVVIIENTRLGWDEERKKWKGLGIEDIRKSLKNVENLEYAKVKCLFDMNGQKSSALVVFPATFEGYFEAEALNDQLERSGKGKDQWMKVRPQELNLRTSRGFVTPELVSPDGKRILYGYLAQPEDIQRADPHKNSLKWFIESFNDKVRKPAQQRHQDKELQRATYLKLEEEARRHKERLESEQNEVQDLMERVKEQTKKLEVDRERELAERQKYERDINSKMKKNEEEKRNREQQFYEREQEIRKTLEEYKQTLLQERERKAREADAVRHGIDETIKQHQAKLAEECQLEALEEMKLEAQLRAEMESKLFELEQKRQMGEKAMQDRQQEQLKELKLANLKEREELLRQTIVQQEALMKEMEDAVRETQALKQRLQEEDYGKECVICLDEFGHEPDRQRAHYKDCDHANVCIGCAMDLWKHKKKRCPYCNTPAKQKPGRLPAKIYF